jgi:hypothetical protein
MKVVYMAHRLGQGAERELNRSRAAKLVAHYAKFLGVAPIADWIILAGEWPETLREKGLLIDFALIERCDELWMIGRGPPSTGMMLEAAEATRLGKPVHDLTLSQ